MSIDYSKYSAEAEFSKEKWKPPISESVINERSNKLAMSTRCYPEYMLAAFAYLEEERGATINSMSDLIYKIICDYINTNRDEIGNLPDAETALDFLLMKKWITPENAENLLPIGKIREKQSQQQARIDSGQASLKERYEYWKDRDPEKAEELMDKMLQQFQEHLTEGDKKDSQEQVSNRTDPQEETLAGDNRSLNTDNRQPGDSSKPSLDYLDDVPTADSKENQ